MLLCYNPEMRFSPIGTYSKTVLINFRNVYKCKTVEPSPFH